MIHQLNQAVQAAGYFGGNEAVADVLADAPVPDAAADGCAEPQTAVEEMQFSQIMDAKAMKELFKQNRMLEDEQNDPAKERLEEQLETLRAIAAIKQKLSEGAARLNKTAVQELMEAGISLEKIGFAMLSDMMVSLEITDNSPPDADALAQAESRLNSLSGLDGNAIGRLLREEKPLTYENAYAARFSAANAADAPVAETDDGEWESLEAQTLELFRRQGVAVSPETLDAARFLVGNNVPVSGENVDKAMFLRALAADGPPEALTERMARHIQAGSGVWQFSLYEPEAGMPGANAEALNAEYASLMEELPAIKPERVDLLVQARIPLTLANLRREEPQTAPSEGADAAEAQAADAEKAAVAGRKQLAEIQLTMTLSAARRLAGKGIDINTLPLAEAVERLRAAVDEGYAGSLRAMGAEDGPENVSAMRGLFSSMTEINPLTNNVYGGVITRRTEFTVAGVHRAVQYARAREGYEMYATAPSPKHGDAFDKVRGRFGALLESLGVEAADANVRAAAILSRCDMDVTPEAVEQVRLIDAKLEYAQNRLHPHIAASIIKGGANPMDMDIDGLIDAIDSFNDAYGENVRDAVASHILDMDARKELAAEERQAMMAIYRMLAAAQRNGGAALGVLLKSGAPFTLGGMLEASKYYSRARGGRDTTDVTVDDGFGSLDELKIPENNVAAAARSLEAFTMERFARGASPGALSKLLRDDTDVMDQHMERLAEALSETDAEEVRADRALEGARQLFSAKATTIHFMERHAIPVTAGNAAALSSLRKDPFFLGRELDRLEKDLKKDSEETEFFSGILPEGSVSGLGGAGEVSRALQERLAEVKQAQTDRETAERVTLIQHALEVQDRLLTHDGRTDVKLPVRLSGGRIASLNMYIINDMPEDETGSVLLSLNTRLLGNVSVMVEEEGGRVSLEVRAENPGALARLAEGREELLAALEQLGFEVDGVRFAAEGARNTLDQDMTPDVDLSVYAAKYERSV